MKDRGGVAVVHYDTDYLARGTHRGLEVHRIIPDSEDVIMPSDGAADPTYDGYCRLFDPGKDFRSCGILPGVAVYNDTDGSNGTVQSVTEDEIYCDLTGGTKNNWSQGDQYSVYKTDTYGSKISTHYTDRRFGRKVTGKDTLIDGLIPEDVDLDEKGENVFGPNQPSRA